MMYTYRTRPARPELMMDRILRDFCGMPERPRRPRMGFPVDVRQTDAAYILEAELPGVKLENIEITIENDVLTIAADMNAARADAEGYMHVERRAGRMERAFTLEGIRQADITAACADGVLTITLPKEAPEAGKEKRRIAINGVTPEVVTIEAPAG